MDAKVCSICTESKSLDCFVIDAKAKTGKSSYCKSCQKIVRRKQYLKTKDKEIARAIENQKKFKDWYKSIKPDTCSRCGFTHPAVIDFHHPDDNKEGSVSQIRGKKRLLAEIEKCIPLCSNCHRILHYEKKNMTNA